MQTHRTKKNKKIARGGCHLVVEWQNGGKPGRLFINRLPFPRNWTKRQNQEIKRTTTTPSAKLARHVFSNLHYLHSWPAIHSSKPEAGFLMRDMTRIQGPLQSQCGGTKSEGSLKDQLGPNPNTEKSYPNPEGSPSVSSTSTRPELNSARKLNQFVCQKDSCWSSCLGKQLSFQTFPDSMRRTGPWNMYLLGVAFPEISPLPRARLSPRGIGKYPCRPQCNDIRQVVIDNHDE